MKNVIGFIALMAWVCLLMFWTGAAIGQDRSGPVAPVVAPRVNPLGMIIPMGASNKFERGRMSRSYNFKHSSFDKVFELVRDAKDNQGITDVIYHLPNGKTVAYPMDFDSAVRFKEFQEQGYISEFSEVTPEHFTWRLAEWLKDNTDAKATIYFGSLVKTKTLLKLADEDVGGYYKRFGDSIKFATDLHLQHEIAKDRITIGFDQVGGGIDNAANDSWVPYMPRGSLPHRMIQSVQAAGFPVAIEPHFPNQSPYAHLKEFPVIVTWEYFKQASYNQSVKPHLKHVTVLMQKNSYNDSDLQAAFRNEHVDKVCVAPWLTAQAKRVRDALIAEGSLDE